LGSEELAMYFKIGIRRNGYSYITRVGSGRTAIHYKSRVRKNSYTLQK